MQVAGRSQEILIQEINFEIYRKKKGTFPKYLFKPIVLKASSLM